MYIHICIIRTVSLFSFGVVKPCLQTSFRSFFVYKGLLQNITPGASVSDRRSKNNLDPFPLYLGCLASRLNSEFVHMGYNKVAQHSCTAPRWW